MEEPRVVGFAATDADGTAVRFTVSTDIVDYLESARTFGRDDMAPVDAHGRFQRRMIAIPDRRGDVVTPMVLTIGNESGLSLVRHEPGAGNTGWNLTDLGATMAGLVGGTPQVRALGANWTDDDRITVAVAVDDGTAGAPSRVLVAYDLSSRTGDWGRVSWLDCGTRQDVQVDGIRVLDEGDGTWTVVLSGDRGPNDMVYLLRNDRAPSFGHALVFNPAVTLQEILDFEAGVHPDLGGGLAVLGTSGPTTVLAFRPFPTYNAQGKIASIPPVVPLPCPGGATVVEAGTTRHGGTDLYVGGHGVHLITADELANASDAQVVPVIGPQAAPHVQDLVVADGPDGDTAVWALLQNGDLEFANRPGGGSWSTPLRVRGDVEEIAPVHGDAHAVTSLLVVYTDGRAGTLWQDSTRRVWQEDPLLVANPDQATRVTCYGTSLRLLGPGGVPRPDVTVRVSASVLASVLVNNRAVFIGPNITVETRTDANGSVSLFDKVRSLTPAIYRFDVDGVDGSLDVNPAAGIHERFRTVTPDELRTATVQTPTGATPLLPDDLRSGPGSTQVDVVAGSLNQVSQLAVATDGVVPGVSQVSGSAAFSSVLHPDVLPTGYRWAIQVDARGVRAADGDIIDKLVGAAESVGDFFVNLGDSIADFFEGLGHRIQEAWTFVLHKAEEAVEFVCAIGDKVKRFVLDTLEQVGSFFTWLWQQIKTGLEKLWEWLKFIFDWQDVLRVRRAMVDATDEALRHLRSSVGTMRSSVEVGFDAALAQVNRWRTDAGGEPPSVQTPSAGQTVLDDLAAVTRPVQSLIDQATGNSVVAWVTNKLEIVASELVDFEGPNPAAELVQAAEDFVEGLLVDEVNDLVGFAEQFGRDISRIFDGKIPGAGELNFETIKNALVLLGSDVLEGLLRAVRDLVLRSLDLLQKLIGVARDALFARIRFPFIEHLVKLVTAGAVSVDTSFSVIDGLMLLCAIPATIAYKLVTGEAPLSEGDVIAFPYGSVTVQSGTDAIRRFSWIGGLTGAFVKLVISAYQTYNKAQASISGVPVDPAKAWQSWLAAVFGSVGVGAEVFGRHTTKTTPVTEIEWTMVAISGLLNAKTYALLIAQRRGGDQEQLEKVNAGIDVAGYVIHLVLRTTVYGLVIDADRQSSRDADRAEQLPETLAWMEALFDQAGSALISGSVLDDDPETKAILLGTGALAGKGFAFILDLVRSVTSIASGQLQTN